MAKHTFKTKVALIGAGRWGKNVARSLQTLGALHTICDTSEAVLDTYQKTYSKTKLTGNYRLVLEDPTIHAIAIAAPALQHYKLAKAALIAGKDVYVEKPLCLDTKEGEELIAIAERRGLILMVGHLLQYHPCVRHLQELIGAGELGKLQYISSNRLNLGSIRTEENALWNFAPHDVSVILSLCGFRLPEQVRCMGAAYVSEGVADTTMTTLKFDRDVRAHIYVSWLNPFKEQKLTVVGSGGMVVFDDTKPWDEKLSICRSHVRWQGGHTPHFSSDEIEKIVVQEEEPLLEECRHFLHCCEERLTPKTDGTEALRVLKVLQAAQASMNAEGEAKDPTQQHRLQEHVFTQYYAHPTAVVDAGAKIGAKTKIWHFCHIRQGAVIGEQCQLGQNVYVDADVVVGKHVKIQNNVSLYSGVELEDEVFVGPSAVFTNVLTPRAAISRRDQIEKTMLRRGVTVGANASILCGVELGEYAFVGSGSVVTRDVKPYALVVGNPARQVGWMSRAGERLDLPVEVPRGDVESAICPKTGEEYVVKQNQLELMERAPQVGVA